MVGVERELEVGHQGLAFVAAGGEQDGGPEVFESGEVMGPVADNGVEDGADVGVEADFGVEGVDEGADLGFGDFLFGGHRELQGLGSSLSPLRATYGNACRLSARRIARMAGYDAIGRVGRADLPSKMRQWKDTGASLC